MYPHSHSAQQNVFRELHHCLPNWLSQNGSCFQSIKVFSTKRNKYISSNMSIYLYARNKSKFLHVLIVLYMRIWGSCMHFGLNLCSVYIWVNDTRKNPQVDTDLHTSCNKVVVKPTSGCVSLLVPSCCDKSGTCCYHLVTQATRR
jgi:hypothetical protein